MIGPVIPGLNNHEIPQIIEKAAKNEAKAVGYNLVRLNGAIGEIFEDWARKNFPDRADKILNQIKSCHDGTLGDSQFGRRMRGAGKIADAIVDLYHLAKKKHMEDRKMPPYDLTLFRRPNDRQMSLF